MPSKPKGLRPDRGDTDDSLRAERESSDLATAEGRSGGEERADEVLERARLLADAVLDTAREKADDDMAAASAAPFARAAIVAERILEDELLQDERAAADARLCREREEQTRTLAALLPLERDKTDHDLLTERARSDEKLAHRDDFLGMVSHDLRTLLCTLVLDASLIAQNASDSAEGRETAAGMTRIKRYAARMNGLIGDLVDVVRIDAGKLSVRRQRSDAAALLAEIVESFLPAAAEKGVSLRGENVAVLWGDFDSGRILQVLANLVTNALKFTPRGGSIVIHGERTSNGLRVSVSDTGVGIPRGHLGAVFQRFWQQGKDEARGLGLGLYISKSLIDAHGGAIWAESTVGAGSTFVFTIPDTASPKPEFAIERRMATVAAAEG